jgi:hypothetical protein
MICGLASAIALLSCGFAGANAGTVICRSTNGPECLAFGPHPSTLRFVDGDRGYFYRHLKWHDWGNARATATGIRRNREGTTTPYKAKLFASQPQLCGNQMTYTRLVVHGPELAIEIYHSCTLKSPDEP